MFGPSSDGLIVIEEYPLNGSNLREKGFILSQVEGTAYQDRQGLRKQTTHRIHSHERPYSVQFLLFIQSWILAQGQCFSHLGWISHFS